MAIQIRRTATPDNPPTDLAPGQLSVEMASQPPRLWCGVPVTIDPSGRVELLSGGGGGWNGEIIGGELVKQPGSVMFPDGRIGFVRRHGAYFKHNGQLVLIPAGFGIIFQAQITP